MIFHPIISPAISCGGVPGLAPPPRCCLCVHVLLGSRVQFVLRNTPTVGVVVVVVVLQPPSAEEEPFIRGGAACARLFFL